MSRVLVNLLRWAASLVAGALPMALLGTLVITARLTRVINSLPRTPLAC